MPEERLTAAGKAPASLDDLAALEADELGELYTKARTPVIEDLAGKLVGRMLAVPRAREAHVAALLRNFARSGAFPWQGKTFEPVTHGHGHGINRVVHERFNLFPFQTTIEKSRAGDFEAVQLDYDLKGNPPLVRSIKDEVREVAPGLWLGLAYVRTKKGDKLGLYFGLARA